VLRKTVSGTILKLLLIGMLSLAFNFQPVKAEYSYNVAVTNVTPSKVMVERGDTVSINCTVENQGDFTENFNVSLYYELLTDPIIGTQNVSLASGESTTLTFEWNTTDCGDYTITAYAHPVPDETDITDNNLTCKVRVFRLPPPDPESPWKNLLILARAYGSREGEPDYRPEVDCNEDGKIDWRDLLVMARNYERV
jgi:hypothetical protein